MKNWISGFLCALYALFVLFGAYEIGESRAEARKWKVQVSLQEEWLRSIVPMRNFIGKEASVWEYRAEIREHLDGKWDCKDRAEYAKIWFRRFGYKTRYGTIVTGISGHEMTGHMWTKVYRDGKFIADVMKDPKK